MELDRLAKIFALMQEHGIVRYSEGNVSIEAASVAAPVEEQAAKPDADGFEWEKRPSMRKPTDAEREQRSRRAG